VNTVILSALEEYVTAVAKQQDKRSGKYQALVQALGIPVANLHLSARPAPALRSLSIRYFYELVQQSPTDVFKLPNFGNKSLKEVTDKPAAVGLALDMTLEDDAYRAAIMAAVAANLCPTKG
jgi:DNA-directed RNA polymerase alpha subunit